MRKSIRRWTINAWAVMALMSGSALMAIQPANATVIDGPMISGFDTFSDTNTGRIWLDMNSFFGQTTDQMVAAASAAGFAFALKADVEQLLNSLPLGSGEWLSIYKPIMMDAPDRELIWGSYDDGGNPLRSGWAFAFGTQSVWSFVDDVFANNAVPNIGTPAADMNIWAYRTAVPEPTTILLLGLGLVGLGFSRRRLH